MRHSSCVWASWALSDAIAAASRTCRSGLLSDQPRTWVRVMWASATALSTAALTRAGQARGSGILGQRCARRTIPSCCHEPGTRRHGKPHTATLLFTTPEGRALHRNAFNEHVWHPARDKAGLDADRVNGCHMLRHVYASTLIARGVDVRTVAEYLGHSDGGALVLRTYSHLLPDAEDRARKAIEDALAESVSPETDEGAVDRLT